MEADIGVTCLQVSGAPKTDGHHTHTGRNKQGFFPRALRRSRALLTPWLWTFSFPNCERMNFCCFKPLSLWHFVTAALGTNARSLSHPYRSYSVESGTFYHWVLEICFIRNLCKMTFWSSSLVLLWPSLAFLSVGLPQSSVLTPSFFLTLPFPRGAHLPSVHDDSHIYTLPVSRPLLPDTEQAFPPHISYRLPIQN